MMATNRNKQIWVYADWAEFATPKLMGLLSASLLRGKEVFAFEYDNQWLLQTRQWQLDPDLGLYGGNQYAREGKSNFGLFLDSSPDRWGRVLMDRREAIMARADGRKESPLLESDYLLGLYDETRMGALRFKLEADGEFLNNDTAMAAPPWINLRDLEYASLQLEKDMYASDAEALKWLNILLAPGSSLGGARPKANVRDLQGALWIAKFPSGKDDTDMGAWEQLAYELALACGIEMAESKIERYGDKNHTFLTKRFDRTAEGKRIHFASAMTLLGYTDGASHQEGVSYLELAEFIMQHGSQVQSDLEQIWRRIVFSICIRNTDDHLRNHGFILESTGWKLSPAYDLNPNPTGSGLKLNISETDNSLDLDLAMEVIPYFRLTETKAKSIVNEIKSIVSGWRTVAVKIGISHSEQERMKRAFE